MNYCQPITHYYLFDLIFVISYFCYEIFIAYFIGDYNMYHIVDIAQANIDNFYLVPDNYFIDFYAY